MTRLARYALPFILGVVVAFTLLAVRTYGTPFHTVNGGITVHVGSMFYGYEVWGHPGFFTEDCSAGC